MKLSKEEWIVFGICLVLLFTVVYFDFPKNHPITVPQLVDFTM
jgi:t-SNARE complex subunit (syntaxin)